MTNMIMENRELFGMMKTVWSTMTTKAKLIASCKLAGGLALYGAAAGIISTITH